MHTYDLDYDLTFDLGDDIDPYFDVDPKNELVLDPDIDLELDPKHDLDRNPILILNLALLLKRPWTLP